MIGSPQRRRVRWLLVTWAALLTLTAASYWIAEVQVGLGGASARLVLGIAVLKAHLIAGVFMEMLAAPRVWALAMSGFLLGLTGLLVALLD